jgi:hypothetical protein
MSLSHTHLLHGGGADFVVHEERSAVFDVELLLDDAQQLFRLFF